MIAQAALVTAARRLREAGVPDPARDARLLLAFAMGLPSQRLTLHLPDELPDAVLTAFDSVVARRAARQPVSQLIGRRQFLGREFRVTQDVLDPRPETETLVLRALEAPFENVLDLGTGSGCILLSLLADTPEATGLGVDLSEAALKVARENAVALGVADRVELRLSDWFSAVDGAFDLIVSNPPYIDEAEWETLDPEPRLWEPKTALTPGADGLHPYRVIAETAARYLKPNGRLLVEIGWQQGPDVAGIFANSGFSDVRVLSDLDGRDRCVEGQIRTPTLRK